MTERDDIEALSRDWRTIPDDTALSVQAVLRRRRLHGAVMLFEALGAALALASALFFWLARDGLVFDVAAVVMLLVALGGGAAAKRARVDLLRWEDWTPEGVLAFRLRDCQGALITARHTLVACAALVAFAAFVWLAAELGWDELPPYFPQLYASIVAAVVVPLSLWAVLRLRAKRAEHARLVALLAEFEQR